MRREPIAGDDLILSIDLRVQKAAEEALGGQRAAVVAIDPRNGDVIAFVSTPTYDPNGFARGLTVPEYRALADNLDKPLYRPRDARRLPAGLDDQAAGRARGARIRRDRARRRRATARAPGSSPARATGTATGRRAATARSTCTRPSRSRATPISTASPTRSASTACTTSSCKFGLGSEDRHRHPRRARRASCRRAPGSARRSRPRRCRSGSPAKP